MKEFKYVPSFIKWAGGKRKLLPYILPIIEKSNYTGEYYEPFLGSGAVALAILDNNIGSGPMNLSDCNQQLISAWLQIQSDPKTLIQRLEEYQSLHSKDFYYEVRAMDRSCDFDATSQLEVAARFIYLNKTCFNGLWRVNKKGQNNVPIGSYINPNILDAETIMNVHALLNSRDVNISVKSYEDVLAEDVNEGDYLYVDPPYIPASQTSNFTSYTVDGFTYAHQHSLALSIKALIDRGIHCLASNSNTEVTRELYSFTNIKEVSITYAVAASASSRKSNSELLIGEDVL